MDLHRLGAKEKWAIRSLQNFSLHFVIGTWLGALPERSSGQSVIAKLSSFSRSKPLRLNLVRSKEGVCKEEGFDLYPNIVQTSPDSSHWHLQRSSGQSVVAKESSFRSKPLGMVLWSKCSAKKDFIALIPQHCSKNPWILSLASAEGLSGQSVVAKGSSFRSRPFHL